MRATSSVVTRSSWLSGYEAPGAPDVYTGKPRCLLEQGAISQAGSVVDQVNGASCLAGRVIVAPARPQPSKSDDA